MQHFLLIGLGGFIGTALRYVTIICFSTSAWATLTVNTFGSLIIGIVYGLGLGYFSPSTMTIITVGLLGGFTTFSSFSAETILFLKEGRVLLALSYVFSMLVLGFVATYLGFSLTKWYINGP